MSTNTLTYQVVDLPAGRRVWVNALELSWLAHTIYGLLDADVTIVRKMIAEHERDTGEKRALMGHTIRAANRKTYREIHDEIRRVQTEPVPPDRGMPGWWS